MCFVFGNSNWLSSDDVAEDDIIHCSIWSGVPVHVITLVVVIFPVVVVSIVGTLSMDNKTMI